VARAHWRSSLGTVLSRQVTDKSNFFHLRPNLKEKVARVGSDELFLTSSPDEWHALSLSSCENHWNTIEVPNL